MVYSEHCARLELHIVSYRQPSVSYILFLCFVQCQVDVAIPVNNAPNYVNIFRIKLFDFIFAVSCEVDQPLLWDLPIFSCSVDGLHRRSINIRAVLATEGLYRPVFIACSFESL